MAERRILVEEKKEVKKKETEAKKQQDKEAKEWAQAKKTIFDIECPSLVSIQQRQNHPGENDDWNYSLPFVCSGTAVLKKFLDPGPLQMHINVFALGFPSHELYSTKGRANADVSELNKVETHCKVSNQN